MDINVTLFGEMLTFAVLVWVTMKYIWPPLTKALNERQQKIADGLQAAERGQRDLELAQQKVTEQLREAKNQAGTIIEQANQQANSIVEDGVSKAHAEGEKVLAATRSNIEQEIIRANTQLRQQTTDIAIKVAEKLLQQHVDATKQQQMIDELIEEI